MKTLNIVVLLVLSLCAFACNDNKLKSNYKNSLAKIKVLNDSIQKLNDSNNYLIGENKKLTSEFDEIEKNNSFFNEDFMSFIITFSESKDFQRQRIKFPILIEEAFIGSEDSTYTLSYENWNTEKYKFHPEGFNIYDNKEAKLKNSNYRVLNWYSIESSGDLQFYFKAIDGKWFLYKISHSG